MYLHRLWLIRSIYKSKLYMKRRSLLKNQFYIFWDKYYDLHSKAEYLSQLNWKLFLQMGISYEHSNPALNVLFGQLLSISYALSGYIRVVLRYIFIFYSKIESSKWKSLIDVSFRRLQFKVFWRGMERRSILSSFSFRISSIETFLYFSCLPWISLIYERKCLSRKQANFYRKKDFG